MEAPDLKHVKELTTLRRGLSILRELSFADPVWSNGLTVTELSQLVGCDKSQTSRTLRTLFELGFVERNSSTRAYSLGWATYLLAQSAFQLMLIQLGSPLVQLLSKHVNESAYLAVLQGPNVLTVQCATPNRGIQAIDWIGKTVPLHRTASGRALLMDCNIAMLHRMLREYRFESSGVGGTKVQSRVPDNVDKLYGRIEASRPIGFVIARGELEPGLATAAAPVRDHSNDIVAALGVAGPEFRMASHLKAAGSATKAAADKLTELLMKTKPSRPSEARLG